MAGARRAPTDTSSVSRSTTWRRSCSRTCFCRCCGARRLRAAGETSVTVNALHPASLMPTKMVRESFGYTMSTIADGLEATRRLVIAPELDGVSGRYFDRLEEGRAEPQAYDAAARRRLWQLSEELVAAEAASRPER